MRLFQYPAAAAPPALSLSHLQAHDPTATGSGGGAAGAATTETRFLCPLPPCADHQNTARHRSLSANIQTGAWHCHRCHARGLLAEFQTRRHDGADVSPSGAGQRSRAATRARTLRRLVLSPLPVVVEESFSSPSAFAEPSSSPLSAGAESSSPSPPISLRIARACAPHGLRPLRGTPGATYLAEIRGLDVEICHAAGVRYAPRWYGRPAVVFPVRDGAGHLVAAQGRHIGNSDDTGPRMRTCGDRKAGVFQTPNALAGLVGGDWATGGGSDPFAPVVVCEAPIDALSLAQCGLPAVALCGARGAPLWLLHRCYDRDVWAAFDADDAGEAAAVALAEALRLCGAVLRRLRPPPPAADPNTFPTPPCKDWNDALRQIGADALKNYLLNDTPPPPPPVG